MPPSDAGHLEARVTAVQHDLDAVEEGLKDVARSASETGRVVAVLQNEVEALKALPETVTRLRLDVASMTTRLSVIGGLIVVLVPVVTAFVVKLFVR